MRVLYWVLLGKQIIKRMEHFKKGGIYSNAMIALLGAEIHFETN
jgi:hypothetical protein